MSITEGIRVTDRIMGVVMDPVMAPVTLVALAMALTQALSRSRLVIGPIIIAALVIMWAGAITSGGRDIGYGATVKESGSTATTL